MTHNRDHIVIQQFKAPVGVGPAPHSEEVGKFIFRVWHVVAIVLVIGFIAGAIIF